MSARLEWRPVRNDWKSTSGLWIERGRTYREADMTKQQALQKAESMVRRVLTKDFHQKVDEATVRAVALKVAKALPAEAAPKQRPARAAA